MLKVQMLPGPTLGIGVDMVEESISQVPRGFAEDDAVVAERREVRRSESSEPDPTAFRTPLPMIFLKNVY
jgi:hypothetical protein